MFCLVLDAGTRESAKVAPFENAADSSPRKPRSGVAGKSTYTWHAVRICTPEASKSYVPVMSLHKSKGLTAECVVVTGCIEGALPEIDPDIAIVDQEHYTEEQRRLMYVAITRTKKILMLSKVLSVPKALAFSMNIPTRGGKGVDVATQTSRFLGELGPSSPAPIMGNML